jgi:hypothetical protein
MGMTGSFHRSWGDFGSVRNQVALDYECFRMLAGGNQCCTGEHLHPRGKLNPVVYERIGRTYRSVAEKEPWCQNAKPLTEVGLDYEGPWQHEVQYREVTDVALNQGLSHMVQILYEKGRAVRLKPGTQLLGRGWKAYFDRNYLHFQVEQPPFSEPSDYVGISQRGNLIYVAAPIFRMYADFGYQFYRLLIGNCIARFLPNPLIKSNDPSTAHLTVTKQAGRMIVHVLPYAPQRRTPALDIVEDVIPLFNLKLALRMGAPPKQVYLAPQRHTLKVDFQDSYARTVAPSMEGHQMIVFET